MQPEIRDVTIDDNNAILRINADATPMVSPLGRADLGILIRACSLFRLIEVDTQVVGYLCAMCRNACYDGEEFQWFRKQLCGNYLYIDQVAVARPYRNMGFGHALYEDMQSYAQRKGINKLVCEVNYSPVNAESLAFHRKHGCRELGKMETRGIVVALLAKHYLPAKTGSHFSL